LAFDFSEMNNELITKLAWAVHNGQIPEESSFGQDILIEISSKRYIAASGTSPTVKLIGASKNLPPSFRG